MSRFYWSVIAQWLLFCSGVRWALESSWPITLSLCPFCVQSGQSIHLGTYMPCTFSLREVCMGQTCSLFSCQAFGHMHCVPCSRCIHLLWHPPPFLSHATSVVTVIDINGIWACQVHSLWGRAQPLCRLGGATAEQAYSTHWGHLPGCCPDFWVMNLPVPSCACDRTLPTWEALFVGMFSWFLDTFWNSAGIFIWPRGDLNARPSAIRNFLILLYLCFARFLRTPMLDNSCKTLNLQRIYGLMFFTNLSSVIVSYSENKHNETE